MAISKECDRVEKLIQESLTSWESNINLGLSPEIIDFFYRQCNTTASELGIIFEERIIDVLKKGPEDYVEKILAIREESFFLIKIYLIAQRDGWSNTRLLRQILEVKARFRNPENGPQVS